MKFSVNSETLSKRVKMLAKVAQNQALPILDNILVEVVDETLKLTASDSENTLYTEIPLESCDDGECKVCIDAKTIADALANIPQQPITITIEKEVSIQYQNGVCHFACMDAMEYPKPFNLTDEETMFTMPSDILVECVSRCIPFLAIDEIRVVMGCVAFDIKEDQTNIVSSDGGSLMKNTLNIKSEKPFTFMLPKKPANLLRQVFGGTIETIARANDKYAEFRCQEWKLTCRLQDGRYPNYNSVIPKNYNKRVTLDKATLKSALKRVQPMGNQASNLVKIDISCNNMEVSTYDVDFNTSAKENITCDCGEYLTIGMNSTKILSILDLIPGAIVSIDFEDQTRPWVITPEENQDNLQILALQMPMYLD